MASSSKHLPQKTNILIPSKWPPIFNLTETNVSLVTEQVAKLSPSKACGLDGLTARLIKDAGPTLIPVITSIINLSITTNTFPATWKIASVTPIYKSGSHDDPNNYRPISLLPIISKITERIVHDQVYAFLRSNRFFNEAQSGFRKGHSAITCLLDFLDGIHDDIERGVVSGVLFLDLRKAFNSVNHYILLRKLRSAGLTEFTVNWFASYL